MTDLKSQISKRLKKTVVQPNSSCTTRLFQLALTTLVATAVALNESVEDLERLQNKLLSQLCYAILGKTNDTKHAEELLACMASIEMDVLRRNGESYPNLSAYQR